MSLYAIGDLHLHFEAQLKNPGQLRDPLWKGHEERFRDYCRQIMKMDDTLVLVGDHSWGKDLTQCEKDLQFIGDLPGRKILTRGNHDMFWDIAKTDELNRKFQPDLTFLQNGYETYGDYALVATKGFTFEGPFYLDGDRRIIGWDLDKQAHAEKLIERELKRLRRSLEKARDDGYGKIIMFLHYPPTSILEDDSGFTSIAEEFKVERVVYAHCHGQRRFHDSIIGQHNGIEYSLVSGDFLRWIPLKILD